MKFEKDVLFLGMQSNGFSDGGRYFSVQFYNESSGPVLVNVMDNSQNAAIIDVLLEKKFGAPVKAGFVLKPKDKLYRLALDHVA